MQITNINIVTFVIEKIIKIYLFAHSKLILDDSKVIKNNVQLGNSDKKNV